MSQTETLPPAIQEAINKEKNLVTGMTQGPPPKKPADWGKDQIVEKSTDSETDQKLLIREALKESSGVTEKTESSSEKVDPPRPEVGSSSPDSAPQPTSLKLSINPIVEEEPLGEKKFNDFYHYLQDSWGVHSISEHIKLTCRHSFLLQPYTNWALEGQRVEVAEIVSNLLHDRSFMERLWPSLKVVMSDNVDNFKWTASVATSVALFTVVLDMRTVLNELKGKTDG